MKCSDFEALLSSYANNELSRTQREFIEEHLSDCAECQSILAEYIDVKRSISLLKKSRSLPDLSQAIMSTIRKAKLAQMKSPKKTGIKEAVMAQIKGTKTGGTARKWIRPALVSIPVLVIMITLLIIQPWNAANDSKGLLAHIISASGNIQSYRVTTNSSYTDLEHPDVEPAITETTWEFVLPDRVHSILYSNRPFFDSDGPRRIEERTEYYIIGESLYYRTDNDKDMVRLLENNNTYYLNAGGIPTMEYTLGRLQLKYELQQLPDENIDGVDYLHYEMIPKFWNGPAEIWIDKDEFLVRQVTRNNEYEDSIDIYSKRYYDFNTDITIEPPLTATGELLPGWEVEDIGETISPIPVFDAIEAISGVEDWNDLSVISEVLTMFKRVTDPQAYFNALPSEAQDRLNFFLLHRFEDLEIRTTEIGYEYDNGVLRYKNSFTGLDVYIDTRNITRSINGDYSGGVVGTQVVNLWISAIQASDPQAYFDALPEEARQGMAVYIHDYWIAKLVTDALEMRPPGSLEIWQIFTIFLVVLSVLFAVFLVWFMKIKVKKPGKR